MKTGFLDYIPGHIVHQFNNLYPKNTKKKIHLFVLLYLKSIMFFLEKKKKKKMCDDIDLN